MRYKTFMVGLGVNEADVARLAHSHRVHDVEPLPTWHLLPKAYEGYWVGSPTTEKTPAGHWLTEQEKGHMKDQVSSKPAENPANPAENHMDDHPNYYAVSCGIRNLLAFIGEDPGRDGLKDTPHRVIKAFKEMTSGYAMNPKDILAKTFEQDYDQMIVVRNVPFVSLCEHHLLPFIGSASIGYLPAIPKTGCKAHVVGLSKIARLVECYARRLQIQERLTQQVAEAIFAHLAAAGVGVVVRAEHSCMACRGVNKAGVEMVTSVMLGSFREEPETRAEFLALCRE